MKNRMKNRWLHVFIQIFSVIGTFIIAQIIGYFLTVPIWSYNGGFLQFVVALLFGIVVFFLLVLITNLFLKKGDREKYNAGIYNALEQISRGNFNINIAHDGHFPYGDLIEKINKMAADLGTIETLKSDFVSNVSHEIQSPLTSIVGYVTLLEKNNLPENLRMEYLNIIKTESERLSKLSKNLLNLSSLDAGLAALSKTNFRLDTQIQNVIILFEPQLNAKNISIDVNLAKANIIADAELMQQVLINIIHNAIKFTPGGGKIDIELKQDDSKTTLKISDNGIGISPENLPHIFERFYKAYKARTRADGGSGLGLSIVKKIVTLHGGEIVAESELNKGTTFIITL